MTSQSSSIKPLIPAASLVALLLAMVAPANATNMEVLLERLHKKGVLTTEEYNEMRDVARSERQQAAKEKATAMPTTAGKEEVVSKWKNALSWESGDGQHAVGLTGRMHFDYRDNSNDFAKNYDRDTSSLANNYELRRAQLGVKGYFYKDIGYEVVGSFVGSNTNTIDTAQINLGYFKPAQLRVGRFTQPFNLEEISGSNGSDFLESSYVNQISPAKKLGAMLHGQPAKGVNYGISVFQEGFNETTNETGRGKQVAARAAVNIAELAGWKNSVMHLGLAGTAGDYNLTPTTSSQTSAAASTTTRGTVVGFRSAARGLTNIYRAQLAGDALTTATYSGSSNTDAEVNRKLQGVELAAAYGPVKLQGEWAKAKIDGRHTATGSFVKGDLRAYYGQVMWNITGENWSDAYKGGAFGGIAPKNNFNPGSGSGAWQLGLRYSKYDASGISIGNGTAAAGAAREQNSDIGNTITLGLNWILNPNTRIMLNYDRTRFNSPVTPVDVTLLPGQTNTASDEKVVSIRGQVAF
jgi:phosphate-selective porin OprO/OprP